MKHSFLLQSKGFSLSLDFQVFELDSSYKNKTILNVSVLSEGFSASTTMDVDIENVAVFCTELKKLYVNLKGSAKIEEAYGRKQNILFFADEVGHILISGTVNSNGTNGFWQELKFQNRIDQTFLLPFLENLAKFLQQFAK